MGSPMGQPKEIPMGIPNGKSHGFVKPWSSPSPSSVGDPPVAPPQKKVESEKVVCRGLYKLQLKKVGFKPISRPSVCK